MNSHKTENRLPVPIVTQRLVIRDAIRTDMRGWSALYRSPKVRLHLNGPLKRKAQDWWSNQQDIFADVDRPLSVVLSESNELVGVCGFLIADQPNEPDEWEAWLLLRSKYWGKAMGVEITSALIAVAFKSLAAQRVIGIVDPANHASLAMIKKLGFSYMRDYSDPSNPSNWQNGHHIYGVESNTISPTLRRDKAG